MCEPGHGLADGHDLAGLGKRRRNDAFGIGPKVGIAVLIAGEIERAAGALETRPVTVASFGQDAAIVTSGLDEGDKVVTLGVQKLEAGLKVRTVEIR